MAAYHVFACLLGRLFEVAAGGMTHVVDIAGGGRHLSHVEVDHALTEPADDVVYTGVVEQLGVACAEQHLYDPAYMLGFVGLFEAEEGAGATGDHEVCERAAQPVGLARAGAAGEDDEPSFVGEAQMAVGLFAVAQRESLVVVTFQIFTHAVAYVTD